MEMQKYIDIIMRRKILILGVFLSLMIFITILILIIPPKFASTVSIRVLTPTSGGTNYVNFDIYYANRLMNTYTSMASSNLILDDVVKKHNLSDYPNVKAETIPDTEIIEITVLERNPSQAVEIANSVALSLLSKNADIALKTNTIAEASLTNQINEKKDQILEAQERYKSLINPNSQNNSRIATLLSQIESNQDLYVTMYDRYETGRQGNIDSNILSSQAAFLFNLQIQLDDERATLEELNIKAADFAEQIRSSLKEVTLLEQESSSISSQLDQIKALRAIQRSTETLLVIDYATPAKLPASPNYLLVFPLGIIFSLFLAILAGFFIDNLNQNKKSAGQSLPGSHIPYLGKIHKTTNMSVSDEASMKTDPNSHEQLDFGMLIRNKSVGSLLFSSIGKTINPEIVAIQAAKAYAAAGIKTILLDANLKSPAIHPHFPKMSYTNGLVQVLTGKIKLETAIKESGIENLSILPAGKLNGSLDLSDMQNVLEQLSQKYSMIFADFSCVSQEEIPNSIISSMHGIVLLANLTETPNQTIKAYIERMSEINSSIIGYVDFQENVAESSPEPKNNINTNMILAN